MDVLVERREILEREIRAAIETIDELREAEGRAAWPHEIAAVEELVHAQHEVELEIYHERYRFGHWHGYTPPPKFPPEWWVREKARLQQSPAGADVRKRILEMTNAPDPEPASQRTRSLSDLSPAERERLEGEVARHLATGTPSQRGIADRFQIARRQVNNLVSEMERGRK
jgi:hypothetical protein